MEPVICDLEQVLRNAISKELIVENYKTEYLLSKGENHLSTIVKVDATIRKSKDSSIEKLFLIAKTIVKTNKDTVNSTVLFNSETAMYKDLIQSYRRIDKEFGDEADVFDFAPKYYGSRLSIDATKNEADENVLLLLENLKIKGYCTMNRIEGLDLAHVRPVLKKISKFHALGLLCKRKDPETFKTVKHTLEQKMSAEVKDKVKEIDKVIKDYMKSHYFTAQGFQTYKDRISAALDNAPLGFVREPTESVWSTFVHGDLWVNNILFLHNEQDEVIDCKFVDFQLSMYTNALTDLIYFFASSCNEEVLENNVQELLDLYYENLTFYLKKYDCYDETAHSKNNFYSDFTSEAKLEFYRCTFALKFVTLDDAENRETDVHMNLTLSKPNPVFEKRLYHMTRFFSNVQGL